MVFNIIGLLEGAITGVSESFGHFQEKVLDLRDHQAHNIETWLQTVVNIGVKASKGVAGN